MMTSRETYGQTSNFPLRGRKEIQSIHQGLQSNALHSNESIVYNQATKIKVYPSEWKINSIEFSALTWKFLF